MLEDRLSVRASFISGTSSSVSFIPLFFLPIPSFSLLPFVHLHLLSFALSPLPFPFLPLSFSFPSVHIFIRCVLHSPFSRVFPNSILNLNHDLTVTTLCSLLPSQAPRSWACSRYKLPNYNPKVDPRICVESVK